MLFPSHPRHMSTKLLQSTSVLLISPQQIPAPFCEYNHMSFGIALGDKDDIKEQIKRLQAQLGSLEEPQHKPKANMVPCCCDALLLALRRLVQSPCNASNQHRRESAVDRLHREHSRVQSSCTSRLFVRYFFVPLADAGCVILGQCYGSTAESHGGCDSQISLCW